MTSHEMAQILLSLPNIETVSEENWENISEIVVTEIPDSDHPDYVPFPLDSLGYSDYAYNQWLKHAPKKQVIMLKENREELCELLDDESDPYLWDDESI